MYEVHWYCYNNLYTTNCIVRVKTTIFTTSLYKPLFRLFYLLQTGTVFLLIYSKFIFLYAVCDILCMEPL